MQVVVILPRFSENVGVNVLRYGGNWVSLLATWKPIIGRLVKHKKHIDPSIERCPPASTTMGWRDVRDTLTGYKFDIFSRLTEFTRPMKSDLPGYLVNSISRLSNTRCWMDRFFEPDYAAKVKEHPPCGFSYLCPYCRSRYCCKPLYRGLVAGLRRQKLMEEKSPRHNFIRLMRVSFRLQWNGAGNCYNVMKKAVRVLDRLVKDVQRFKGDRSPRVRGGIVTANLTYHDGRWKVHFRSVMLQDVRSPDKYLWTAVRMAVRACGIDPVKTMRSFSVVPSVTVEPKGRIVPAGVVIVRESAWATRFFDVSAAPPDKILAMMRGRRRMRLQRRFGVCHKKHGKSAAMMSIWRGYFQYRGETNATNSADCSQGRSGSSDPGRHQGGTEVSLSGAEEAHLTHQADQQGGS